MFIYLACKCRFLACFSLVLFKLADFEIGSRAKLIEILIRCR